MNDIMSPEELKIESKCRDKIQIIRTKVAMELYRRTCPDKIAWEKIERLASEAATLSGQKEQF